MMISAPQAHPLRMALIGSILGLFGVSLGDWRAHPQSRPEPQPLTLSAGYHNARLNAPDDAQMRGRYHTLNGGAITARWLSVWGVGLSCGYRASYESMQRTPPASTFTPQPSSTPSTLPLSQPSESPKIGIGWSHHLSLGAHLSKRWGGPELHRSVDLSTGGEWRVDAQGRGEAISALSDLSGVHVWSAITFEFGHAWLSARWGGVVATAAPWAHRMIVGGARWGRARLGVGWAQRAHPLELSDHQERVDGVPLTPHGLISTAELPLSAPLYLTLSAWALDLGSGGGRSFTVGLRWTGETVSPERDAPKPNPTGPRAPRRGDPAARPSPFSPMSPPSSPQGPRPLSPSPITPSSSPPQTPL